MVTVAILVLIVGLHLAVIRPLEAIQDAARAQQDTAADAREMARQTTAGARSNTGSALASLLAVLPPADARERQLDALGQQALRADVTWLGAAYVQESESALPVTRTTLRLAVRGSHGALRDFLSVLLAENPGLAVTTFAIEAGGDGLSVMTLEARSYFRADAPGASP